MNLPHDVLVVIFSYFPKIKLHSFAMTKSMPRKLIYDTMIHKFPTFRHEIIEGVVYNFYRRCFKCHSVLGMNYNVLLCFHCSPELEKDYSYPMICHNCTDDKLERGEMKFSFCPLCHNPTSHLGITPFS